ncbi:MAG: GNAT family N-acetyltransferase [Bradyrhizobium sp.]
MNKRSFRRATAADASTVRDITHAAYTKWIAVIGRKPKPMTADYDKAVVNNVIDLLEEDGRPIALIEMIPELSFEPAHLLIENIAVLPEWHGEGIGSVLLQRAETIARTFGVNEMRLYFHAKFVANHLFYARRGFVEFSREPHPAGGEIVHMKKSIEG